MTGRRTSVLLSLFALVACIGLAAPARACPFCGQFGGGTLTQEVNQASMVLYGTFTNARAGAAGEFGGGTTDLVIEKVIKPHKIVENKNKITLDKYVPPVAKTKWLVFCDVFKGKIDPYRGLPLRTDDMPNYLAGATKVKDKKNSERLRFFFDYLNNEDQDIATDAFKEFANVDYPDYRDIAPYLPADKVAKWLTDPKTPSFRFGLYASILGHSPNHKAEYAKLLRSLAEDPEKRVNTGLDGILASYVMLQPKEGWQFIRGILKDSKQEFTARYAALRGVRFYVDYRSDIIPKKDCIEAISQLLDQGDIADLAIEDLRKWKAWDMTDRILALKDKESHNIPIIRRSILRFSLSSPTKAAKAYVEDQRKRDEQSVLDAEELLKIEQQNTQTQPAK
jgi:hypothetical protein